VCLKQSVVGVDVTQGVETFHYLRIEYIEGNYKDVQRSPSRGRLLKTDPAGPLSMEMIILTLM